MIVFDHVSFSYLPDEENYIQDESRFAGQQRQKCLDDLDFTIPKGGSLGIIGATGSGKTSIINLLMRFYDPQGGTVYIDGKDVRCQDRQALRRRFGVVFQNDVIFADTIRENIVFGRALDDGQMKAAASDAMASGFIERYEDTYDHKAVIAGANFSGGQKQRLLIARSLAAHPDILVLDDASSNMLEELYAALGK